jgi:hypothetical protein
MIGIPRTATIAALFASTALLAACGSDPQPTTNVVVVPQAQPAAAPTTTVVPPGTTVVQPQARVICSDGRTPPC